MIWQLCAILDRAPVTHSKRHVSGLFQSLLRATRCPLDAALQPQHTPARQDALLCTGSTLKTAQVAHTTAYNDGELCEKSFARVQTSGPAHQQQCWWLDDRLAEPKHAAQSLSGSNRHPNKT
jgi:hypothetical protein